MNNWPILVVLVSALFSGLFSTLIMSLRSFSRAKLMLVATRRSTRTADRLTPIIDNIPDHVLALSIMRVLSNLTIVGALYYEFVGPGISFTWIALLTATLVAGAITYIVGMVVPVSIANHAGEVVLCCLATLIRVCYFLTLPLTRPLRFVDVIVRRLAGVAEFTEAEELERELISVVAEGESEGSLSETERDMIEAVVEFRSTSVAAVMTPRTEIEGFEITDDLGFIKKFIEEAGHSRIPVYEEDLDHIAGILYAKDLLSYLGKDPNDFKLRSVLRQPHFVPESKKISELLAELQREKVHIAIIVDEYGGTAGLITIEDVIEEIVGEITDEYEPATETPPEILLLPNERAVVVDGRAYIDDVNDKLEDIGQQLPENEEYDTVGGFVITALGHMPDPGEVFSQNGFFVTVLEAEPTRVTRVRVEFRETESAEIANGNGT